MIEILVAMESLGIYKAWVCICIIIPLCHHLGPGSGIECGVKLKESAYVIVLCCKELPLSLVDFFVVKCMYMSRSLSSSHNLNG